MGERTLDRRITFFDLMALVAATAAGLATLRPYLASFDTPSFRVASHWRTIEITYGLWSCMGAWWMVALLFLRYRRPYPARVRLARRPGHAACCAAAAAMVVGGVHELTTLRLRPPSGIPFSFYSLWITVSAGIGPTVAGAWLILALSGRWRSDPGWIDRLGRLLGCCWIGWRLFWMIPMPLLEKIPPIWDGLLP